MPADDVIVLKIGRQLAPDVIDDYNCDIKIDNPYVSGLHATLSWDEGRWLLRDAGSSNGLYVNSTLIYGRTHLISPPDQIGFSRWATCTGAELIGMAERVIADRR